MKTAQHTGRASVAWSLAGLTVVGAVLGAGLAGWLDRGATIFLAMAESGLSWCF